MFKKTLIIFTLLCCFCFSGCSVVLNTLSGGEEKNEDEYVHPYFISRDTRDMVKEYVECNDANGISGLFCEAEPISADEVQELLDLIQGKITSIEPNAIHGGTAESNEGIYTYYSYAANITIYTDLNMEYIVAFGGIAVWDGHPERIGIDSLTLIDEQTGERYDI